MLISWPLKSWETVGAAACPLGLFASLPNGPDGWMAQTLLFHPAGFPVNPGAGFGLAAC